MAKKDRASFDGIITVTIGSGAPLASRVVEETTELSNRADFSCNEKRRYKVLPFLLIEEHERNPNPNGRKTRPIQITKLLADIMIQRASTKNVKTL